MSLVEISDRLARRTSRLRFSEPTAYVYNPLVYARAPHHLYLERFGGLGAKILLVGMNPGPFGMAQTGVPFGEIAAVRDWLEIHAPVSKPAREHPKRPITGFDCTRAEVSGARLWGWARSRFSTPEAFFSRFFVTNYCPLVFMEAGGRNRTPDKLLTAERDKLFAICDEALRETVRELGVSMVLGVGAFACKRAGLALAGIDVDIATILHPSPASPMANRGWGPQVEKQLADLGVALP
ncbi:MAG: single-strand selective monofunctional uracil DNA glycosylase [Hyphomicrobiaceae bacterium]|jgi:single-strand selective monofunctional uracil DNA glycosylase